MVIESWTQKYNKTFEIDPTLVKGWKLIVEFKNLAIMSLF